MKEISSMDFPQHGEVFYFYGQALISLIALKSVSFEYYGLLLRLLLIEACFMDSR
jgi:hypothetical protein